MRRGGNSGKYLDFAGGTCAYTWNFGQISTLLKCLIYRIKTEASDTQTIERKRETETSPKVLLSGITFERSSEKADSGADIVSESD